MEDTPLTLAHRFDRKADNHAALKRFDEAVTCHKNAAELLLQAMQLTSVTRAIESLQMQYEYHKRQEDIIQVKIYQAEIRKKIVDYNRKQKMSMPKKITQRGSRDQDLQWAIFRTMEEADSLLGLLLPNPEAEVSTSPGSSGVGQKRPKDDREVIEELHTLNTQLRAFISQLLNQLEASEKQVEALKMRLAAYEDSEQLPELAPLDKPQFETRVPPCPPDI